MLIGTHDGVFHADEVMACAILRRLYPDARIIRTRDPVCLAQCDILVDVGGVYDDAKKRYDHHQRGFDKKRENGVKYSSAGLVWFHYGTILGPLEVYEQVDRSLIAAIDAADNGQRIHEAPGLVPVQTVSGTISSLNPTWLEEVPVNKRFDDALFLAGLVLERAIQNALARISARKWVEDALLKAHDGYLVLHKYMPWQEVVCGTFARQDVLYVLFPSEDGTWKVQGVPKTPGGFEVRKPLPAEWAGVLEGTMACISGVEDAVFCHSQRFVCGARSLAGAEKLVKMAVDYK